MGRANIAEEILDAFEALLISGGVRAATIDGVSGKVGLSRSGMLHHFGSRARLVTALIERTGMLLDADIAKMRVPAAAAVEYYVRSSLTTSDALERAINAVSRLAQGGDHGAAEALRDWRSRWFQALLDAGVPPAVARLTIFVGDGMSYHVDMSEGTVDTDEFLRPESLDEVLALVTRALAQATE